MLERIVRSIAVAYKDFEDVFNVVSSSKILRQQGETVWKSCCSPCRSDSDFALDQLCANKESVKAH